MRNDIVSAPNLPFLSGLEVSPYGSADSITIVILSLRAAARVLWRGSAPLDGAFFAPSLGRDPRWVTMLLVRGCTSGCGHQAAGCMGQQVHFRVCKRDSCEI